MWLKSFFVFLATNEVFLGISSLCGLVGFVLTIAVTAKTSRISNLLKYNEITSRYNKERLGFQKTFEGHRESIMKDGIKSDRILKEILKNVESYRVQFSKILTIKEKITLLMFMHLLKKEREYVNFNSVCNYLATLSGRLSKKEDKKYV